MTPTLLTIGGETRCIADWARIPGAVDRRTIHRRLARHCDPVQAVFGPRTRGPNVEKAPAPKRRRRRAQSFPVSLTRWGSVQSVTFGRVSA